MSSAGVFGRRQRVDFILLEDGLALDGFFVDFTCEGHTPVFAQGGFQGLAIESLARDSNVLVVVTVFGLRGAEAH